MKDLIVLATSVMLGIFIFNLIAGDGDESIKSNLKTVWEKEMNHRVYVEMVYEP